MSNKPYQRYTKETISRINCEAISYLRGDTELTSAWMQDVYSYLYLTVGKRYYSIEPDEFHGIIHQAIPSVFRLYDPHNPTGASLLTYLKSAIEFRCRSHVSKQIISRANCELISLDAPISGMEGKTMEDVLLDKVPLTSSFTSHELGELLEEFISQAEPVLTELELQQVRRYLRMGCKYRSLPTQEKKKLDNAVRRAFLKLHQEGVIDSPSTYELMSRMKKSENKKRDI